jgi:hypothetical protein
VRVPGGLQRSIAIDREHREPSPPVRRVDLTPDKAIELESFDQVRRSSWAE